MTVSLFQNHSVYVSLYLGGSWVQFYGTQKPSFVLLKVAVQKSTTEVMWELTEVAQELVDIVKNLQNQRALSETGIEKESSILGMVGSTGRGKNRARNRDRGAPTAAVRICLQRSCSKSQSLTVVFTAKHG